MISQEQFEPIAEKCPWYEHGDCIGNITSAYPISPQTEYHSDSVEAKDAFVHESCSIQFCPIAHFINVFIEPQ